VFALAPPAAAIGPEGEAGGVDWAEIGAATLDVAVLRPLGAIATVTGFAFFLASTPLVAPAGRIGSTWDVFVLAPADYTFRRPLGEF
jgi:hypothetical protein